MREPGQLAVVYLMRNVTQGAKEIEFWMDLPHLYAADPSKTRLFFHICNPELSPLDIH